MRRNRIVNLPVSRASRFLPLARCVLMRIFALQERHEVAAAFRADALRIAGRVVRHRPTVEELAEFERAQCPIVRCAFSGSEIVIETFDRRTTYRKLYDEVKLALGIPLCRTTRSLCLIVSSPGPRCRLQPNSIVPCWENCRIGSSLRDTVLIAISHD